MFRELRNPVKSSYYPWKLGNALKISSPGHKLMITLEML